MMDAIIPLWGTVLSQELEEYVIIHTTHFNNLKSEGFLNF